MDLTQRPEDPIGAPSSHGCRAQLFGQESLGKLKQIHLTFDIKPSNIGQQVEPNRSFRDLQRLSDSLCFFDIGLFRADSDARGEMVGLDLYKLGFDFSTLRCSPGAARVEPATLRWIDRGRDVSFQNDALPGGFNFGIRHGHGRNQGLRIRHERLVVDEVGS